MRTVIALALASILLQTFAPVGAQDADPCAGLLPSRLLDTDYSVVAGDDALDMRAEPRFDAPVVRAVPPGEVMRYNHSRACADGARWQRVAWGGDNGWVPEASTREYWLAPYELPEPIVVSQVEGDTTHVVSDLLRFSVPADFANRVTMQPRIGTNFRDAMRVFPNYTRYVLLYDGDDAEPVQRGVIDVYSPFEWARLSPYSEGEIRRLRGYMDTQRELPLADLETGTLLAPPDLPAGGAAQMLSAAQAYADFENGLGFRFLSYYAQMLVGVPEVVSYRFQGLAEDGSLFVSASFGVRLPLEQLPEFDPGIYDTDDPDRLYREVITEAIESLDDGAFSPPLSQIDAMLATLWLGEDAS